MSDTPETEAAAPKKKGKLKKFIVLGVGAAALAGGGAGAAMFLGVGGSHAAEPKDEGPKLVPKSEQKRAGEGGEGEGGGHGGGEEAPKEDHGKPTPAGSGGDKYASNYYKIESDFTANLQDSQHIVQIGLAVSTPYDDTVIEHIKTNEIAVRSAVLMALGDATEDQVFTSDGKKQLQAHLAKAINDTLKEKEGFGGVGNVYFTNFVVQ